MLFSLIPLTLLTLAAVALSLNFRRHFADLLAPVVFSVMLVLYGFYIFGLLHLGRTVVTVLCLLLILSPVCFRCLDKERLKQIFIAPSFRLYLLALAVYFLFAANKFVSLWDCLRLWGASPKAMYAIGALQLGPEALLFPNMQSYPPGMPLLGYFFNSFSPVFSENVLFVSYSFFGLSLMLPFLKLTDQGSKKSANIALLAVLFLPYFITGMNGDNGYYYSSLFIDIPLGICCGYCFSRVFHPKNSFDSLCAVLSCGGLILLKDSGTFLALSGIAGGLICHFLGKDKGNKKRFLWSVAALAVTALTYGSWKYLTGLHTVENHIQLEFTIPSVLTLARLFFYFLRTPVTGIFTLTGAIGFSLPAMLLILFAAKLLARNNRETAFPSELAEVIVTLVCYICFFAGYCFSFLNEIANQDYPSYVRYFCTLVTSSLFVLVYDVCFRYQGYFTRLREEISALFRGDTALGSFLRPARRLLCVGLLIAVVFSAGLILLDFPSRQSDFCLQADASAAAITEVVEAGEDVYLCIPGNGGNNSRLHHRIYFELLDEQIRVKNFFPEAEITREDYGFTDDSFLNLLTEQGYDYVMLIGTDEAILDRFPELFADATLEDTNLIYQVTPTGLTRIR